MFSLFSKSYTEDERKLLNFLAHTSIFESLNDEELYQILPHMILRPYKQDEVVYFAGDPSQAIYVLKSGRVTLNVDIEGNFEELMEIKGGSIFGLNGLLDKSKRIATAIVSSEHAEIYVIPRLNLEEVMDANLALKAKVMETLSQYQDRMLTKMVQVYRNSLGFFDLSRVYQANS